MPRRIRPRTGTSTNWAAKDPTLALNEIGFESDTGRYKIGDGSTAWSSLSYYDDIGPLNLKSYTVATLPTASLWTGAIIHVSDETGGDTVAVSDGSNWKRLQDLATVS